MKVITKAARKMLEVALCLTGAYLVWRLCAVVPADWKFTTAFLGGSIVTVSAFEITKRF